MVKMRDMNFLKDKRKWIIAAILAVEIVLLVVNAFRFNRTESYSFTQDDLLLAKYNGSTKSYDHESGFYADHSNIPETFIVTKPVFLRKGIYSISVTYESNAEDNWHTSYTTLNPCLDISKDRSADLVYSDHIAMPGDRNVVTYDSWVRYGTEFEVRMGPEEDATGDGIYVLAQGANITYMRGRTIVNETAKLFLLFLAIDALLWLILIKREEVKRFCKGKAITFSVMLFTIAFSSYPLLGKALYFGDDIHYHLRRIAYMGEAIMSGQFPIHILPGWDRGYGYAAGVGYGDLLLYPSAFMVMLGFTVQAAYKFYVLLVNVLTSVISYYSFGKIADDKRVGLASSFLFTLIGFRLHSVYSGATVGEFGAFTFLPLVILGLWGIYNQKGKNAYIQLALGVTLSLSCHVLSTFILSLMIPLLCVILIEKTIKKEVLISLLKAFSMIVLLNLHFIVPLADYILFKNIKGNTVNDMLWSRGRDLVTFFGFSQAPFRDTGGFLGLGISFIIVIALVISFIIGGKFGKETGVYIRLFLFTGLLVALSANSMFYFFLMDKIPFLYKLLGNMQFPWHFLDVACGMTAFWFAIVLKKLLDEGGSKVIGYIAIVAICGVCIVQGDQLLADVVQEANPITMYDDAGVSDPCRAEFSIPGIDQSLIFTETDMVIREDTQASASIIKKNGTTIYARVDNPTEENVITEAPLWGYRHYIAKAGGKKLKVYMADSKKLAVEIPAGYSGEIKICFREPWFWRVAELISLATLIYVIIANNKQCSARGNEA